VITRRSSPTSGSHDGHRERRGRDSNPRYAGDVDEDVAEQALVAADAAVVSGESDQ
jgi:hypothetical protein